jgi:hypothetical protein
MIVAMPRDGAIIFSDLIVVCVPKTLFALISWRNHLTSVDNVRIVLLSAGRFGLTIQVEEPA